jgi:hypothetical protein
MNPDLMITIAFCLYVLVGSLAMGVLVAKSIRNDNSKEADQTRRAPGGEHADGSRWPRSTRLQAELPGPGYRSKKRSRATRLGERPQRSGWGRRDPGNEAIAL